MSPAMKVCPKCGLLKPADQYHQRMNHGRLTLRSRCKKCHSEDTRAYFKTPKGDALRKRVTKRNHLFRGYGLTVADYTAILHRQAGGCAICGGQCPSGRLLAVDHDHQTGAVRGLLCMECNNGLGKFRDSPELLRRASEYLDTHGAVGHWGAGEAANTAIGQVVGQESLAL